MVPWYPDPEHFKINSNFYLTGVIQPQPKSLPVKINCFVRKLGSFEYADAQFTLSIQDRF